MKHTMPSPCGECPFRTDGHPYLTAGRVREICESVQRGQSFPCHKTVNHDEDDERVHDPNEMQCAGAEIFLAHQGRSTQMSRFAERLGLPVAELDMSAPVCTSTVEMLRRHGHGDEVDGEPCSIVGPDCEAPAGYLMGGDVVEGTEMAEHKCFACGQPVCSECSSLQEYGHERRLCEDCGEPSW